jgi:hypothetical protein
MMHEIVANAANQAEILEYWEFYKTNFIKNQDLLEAYFSNESGTIELSYKRYNFKDNLRNSEYVTQKIDKSF